MSPGKLFLPPLPLKVKSLSRVLLFATPWTIACQAPPSMGFSRQEYWSGLPFPSPGDLPDPGIEPWSPIPQADSSSSEPPGKLKEVALNDWYLVIVQNTGVGMPSPSPGDLPNPGIKPGSPALPPDSLPTEPPGKPPLPLDPVKHSLQGSSAWVPALPLGRQTTLPSRHSLNLQACRLPQGRSRDNGKAPVWPVWGGPWPALTAAPPPAGEKARGRDEPASKSRPQAHPGGGATKAGSDTDVRLSAGQILPLAGIPPVCL